MDKEVENLSELMATHGNLSMGLADALTEILGREITQVAVLTALFLEGIKLDIDTEGVASNCLEYAVHLRNQMKSEVDHTHEDV